MPRREPGERPRHGTERNWKRPLLHDDDIDALLRGLGLYASQGVYNASEAYRLAKALVDPARGRRERWVEPHFTQSRFLAEIERMTRIHRARRAPASWNRKSRPRPKTALSTD